MNVVPLESILSSLESGARPKGGVSADSGEVPSVGGEHLNSDGGFDFTNIKRVPLSFFEAMRGGRIEPSDILIVKDGATTGKTSFVRDDFPFRDAAVNEHVFCVRVDGSKASPAFVYHFLRSNRGQKAIQLDFRGATVGGISREFATKTKIPLPPLAEQRRIAEVLERAEALRAKRHATLAQFDALAQSLFLDLFGDPISNSKQWKVCRVGEVTDCIVPGRDKPKSFTGNVPWITTADLHHLEVTDSSPKGFALSPMEIAEVRARIIPKGSVILSCVGDLGIVSLAGIEMVINQQLHSFQCRNELDAVFLMHCLAFQKAFMHAKASSTTLPYMNKTVCNSIPVFVPPIALQREFARRVKAVERLRAMQRASLAELDAFFSALHHRAFREEL